MSDALPEHLEEFRLTARAWLARTRVSSSFWRSWI